MIKDNKSLLFERMKYLNPDFKKPLREGMGIGEEEKSEFPPAKKEFPKQFKKNVAENGEEISVEPQEHGNEGASYKAKLEELVELAKKAYEGLPEEELPSWVQDKIVIAKEHLNDVYGWMHGEEEEKEGEIEGSNRKMDDEEEHEEGGEKKKFPFQKKDDESSEDDEEKEEGGEKKSFPFQKKNESAGKSAPAAKKIPVVDIAKVGK
jgi:hypothetical protein